MLFTLSSKNESSPAKFSNYFNDMIDIQPYSYICLVKAQIVRTASQKLVVIPPDTIYYVRYSCYDIVQATLNPGGVSDITYTIPQLALAFTQAILNTGSLPWNTYAEMITVPDICDEEKLELRFYNFTSDPSAGLTWKGYVFGTNPWWNTHFGEITNNTGVVALPPNMVAGANANFVYTNNIEWGCAPIWDTSVYTAPPNQSNAESFNLLVDGNYNNYGNSGGYDPLQFWINQPNPHFTLSLGKTTSNAATPTRYLSGPIRGTPGYDPTNDPNNNLLTFEFGSKPNGVDCMIYIYDSDQDNWGNNPNPIDGFSVDPGDYFEIITKPTPEIPESSRKYFYFQINHYKCNGLLFAYNGNLGELADRPGNANYFLSNNITNPTDKTAMSNMSYSYDIEHYKTKYITLENNFDDINAQWLNDFTQTTTEWNGNACIGERAYEGHEGADSINRATGAGWVYNNSLGAPGTRQFKLSYEDYLIYAQFRFAASVQGFLQETPGQRADGSNIEVPNTFRISTEDIVPRTPTLIVFSALFDVAAETMIPSNLDPNIRTLVGGDNSKTFEIQMNQTGVTAADWDFRLTGSDGSLYSGFLIDDGANRIEFTGSDATTCYNYNFFIRWYGRAVGTFQITVIRATTNVGGTTHTKFDIAASVPLPNLIYPKEFNTIGGVDCLTDAVLTNYNDYSPLTYFSNIRIFQLSYRTNPGGNSEADWNLHVDEMTSYFNQMPDYTTTNAWLTTFRPDSERFYPFSNLNILAPTAAMGTDNKYTNIPVPDASINVCPIFENYNAFGLTPQTEIPLLNGLWVPPLNLMPNIKRITNLENASYSEAGEGLVEISDLDILQIESPEPDLFGNYIQVPTLQTNQGINYPTSTIVADAGDANTNNPSINIEITNLPHRTYNGANKNIDKTIYQLPTITNVEAKGGNEIIEFCPPSKTWIPLQNAGLMPLNQLDVQLSDVDGRLIATTEIKQETNLLIQIENNPALLN